jgi:hypothetical protein
VNDKLKIKVILVLGILTIIFLVTTVTSCNKILTIEKGLNLEKAQRFDVEAKAQKSGQEQAALSGQLKKTQDALQESVKEFEAAKKALIQSQLLTQALKAELNKLSKLKEALEEDLKQALVNGGKSAVVAAQK